MKPFLPPDPAQQQDRAFKPARTRPLSVGVLVDLERHPDAGGHVKCWENFARAAVNLNGQLDLTVHFLGQKDETVPLADHVRFVHLQPVFSTARLPFLKDGPGHTDLAPGNPRLIPYLQKYDLVHATDIFAFARTALRYCRKHPAPLTMSIHTDLPRLTRVYSANAIRNLTGNGTFAEWLLRTCKPNEFFARCMEHCVADYVRHSHHVLVSKSADADWARLTHPQGRISYLRRGIDKERFNPRRRNRDHLARLGIPADRRVLLFSGRLDESKQVMTAAQAVRLLIDRGLPAHFLAVGEGNCRERIATLLGPQATLPGKIPQDSLADLYAASDLFVFPSRSEVSPNVVLEAGACGLPAMVAEGDGGAQFIQSPGRDGFLVRATEPQAWADAIEPLLREPSRLLQAGKTAAETIHAQRPSWTQVLQEDLLPVWRSCLVATT